LRAAIRSNDVQLVQSIIEAFCPDAKLDCKDICNTLMKRDLSIVATNSIDVLIYLFNGAKTNVYDTKATWSRNMWNKAVEDLIDNKSTTIPKQVIRYASYVGLIHYTTVPNNMKNDCILAEFEGLLINHKPIDLKSELLEDALSTSRGTVEFLIYQYDRVDLIAVVNSQANNLKLIHTNCPKIIRYLLNHQIVSWIDIADRLLDIIYSTCTSEPTSWCKKEVFNKKTFTALTVHIVECGNHTHKAIKNIKILIKYAAERHLSKVLDWLLTIYASVKGLPLLQINLRNAFGSVKAVLEKHCGNIPE